MGDKFDHFPSKTFMLICLGLIMFKNGNRDDIHQGLIYWEKFSFTSLSIRIK